MTLPIAFALTPHQLDADTADAEVAFAAVADTTDANFELVNGLLRERAQPRMVQTTGPNAPSTAVTPDTWIDYPGWPAASMVIPANVGTIMVGIGAMVSCQVAGNAEHLGLSFRLSGTTFVMDQATVQIYSTDVSEVLTGIAIAIPKANLTPGATLTATAQYRRGASGTMTSAFIRSGNLWMCALA